VTHISSNFADSENIFRIPLNQSMVAHYSPTCFHFYLMTGSITTNAVHAVFCYISMESNSMKTAFRYLSIYMQIADITKLMTGYMWIYFLATLKPTTEEDTITTTSETATPTTEATVFDTHETDSTPVLSGNYTVTHLGL